MTAKTGLRNWEDNWKGQGDITTMIKVVDATIYDEDNVYDVSEESDKSINGFIESLTNPQFQKLTEFFNEMPTLKHDLEFECSNCGGKNNQELRGLQSFFT